MTVATVPEFVDHLRGYLTHHQEAYGEPNVDQVLYLAGCARYGVDPQPARLSQLASTVGDSVFLQRMETRRVLRELDVLEDALRQ